MTKKKAVKVRDREQTMRLLLRATSEIVQESGFAALTASAVGRRAGRHDTAVNRIFGNLEGLKRAYIQRKDYWSPIFEQFAISAGATEEGMKLYFTELMQENLESFWGNPDMQQMIAWQMTKYDKVMRSVSDEREMKARKMLGLTDKYFAGTNTSFKTVLALLLYGTYGLVLHAKHNGSTVSGIDINNERERQTLHRTLTQVLEWAWESRNGREGKLNKKQAKLTMNYEFDALDGLADERVAAIAAGAALERADPKVVVEVGRLKKLVMRHLISMDSDTQIRTYMQVNLHTLVNICNRLTVLDREHNPDAELVVELLEHIRQDMNSYIPPNLAVPVLILRGKALEFEQQWELLAGHLAAAGISEDLIAITGFPFKKFKVDGNVRWSDYRYLLLYRRELELFFELEELGDDQLRSTLLALGFNSIRFVSYFIAHMEAQLKAAGPEAVLGVLRLFSAVVKQNLPQTDLRYNRYRAPLDMQLLDWIDAERDERCNVSRIH